MNLITTLFTRKPSRAFAAVDDDVKQAAQRLQHASDDLRQVLSQLLQRTEYPRASDAKPSPK